VALDRPLPWSDERIRAHVASPASRSGCSRTTASGRVRRARARADGSVEIVYFGLLPDFIGRRVGRPFLDASWTRLGRRHDARLAPHLHPRPSRALANYVAGGFRVVREEAYTARLEALPTP
jgi:hypothetical protein